MIKTKSCENCKGQMCEAVLSFCTTIRKASASAKPPFRIDIPGRTIEVLDIPDVRIEESEITDKPLSRVTVRRKRKGRCAHDN